MRVKLKEGKQKELLNKFKETNHFTWKEFSKLLKVSEVAIIDWSREKNLLPLAVYQELDINDEYRKYILEFKEENWGQVKAGLNSKGSLKEIKIPEESKELAELIGIVLGDGNIHYFKKGKKIGSYMLRIAGDKVKDYNYLTKYIYCLIKKLFDVEPKIEKRRNNELLVIVHSKKLVEFFISQGLKPGNKTKNKVGIPSWIFGKEKYLKACVRGLIDTDGCIYSLKPKYPNYYQLSFKNYNIQLLKDVRTAFLKLGYPISNISNNKQIYLTQKEYIRKFYKEIGFSNEKHIKRFINSPVV